MYEKNDGTKNYQNSILRFDNLYLGPHSYLHKDAEYIRSIKWKTFDVDVVGTTLGANIYGINPTEKISLEQIDELKKAIAIYKVIIINGFQLTKKQQSIFAQSFGELIEHPFIPSNNSDKIISFIRDKDSGGYENIWHNDLSWTSEPGMYAFLNCIQMPPYGGDTLFADMYAAYDLLDSDIKNELDELSATHDFVLSFGSFFSEEQKTQMQELYKKVDHPIFPIHPITKRKFLYINKNFTSKINGIEKQKSVDLLNHLCSVSSTPEIQYRHKWRYPQMVIWDNFSVQHYAVSDYWPYNRHVDRATVKGPKF